MVNYSQHLKLLLLLLLCALALGLAQEQPAQQQQLEALHRNKRTLTTICVEIKPSGPQEEPYFMCKGTDFSRGDDQPQTQQPMQSYQQPEQQAAPNNPQYAQTPFPSFPSFGAGFYPIGPNYEESTPKATPATSYSEPHAANFGSTAAAYASAPAPQSYGMAAVPYPGAGSAAAAARGNAAGARPAATATAYADAAAQKIPSAAQGAPLPKSQPSSGQASNSNGHGNAYDSLVDGRRYQAGLGEDVLAVPDVGFRPEELNLQYRRPTAGMDSMVGIAPPLVWMPLMQTQLQQPTVATQPPPYYDDPIMRTFYASLDQNEPLTAPAQPAAPAELPVGQTCPGYLPAYAPAQSQPAGQPNYNGNSKSGSVVPYGQASTVDSNVCNSCPCPTPSDSTASFNTPAPCPSLQPVIIAMPCYGQQQPTHYLAVPGSGPASAARDSMVGNPFGAPFGLAGQMGSPYGMNQQVAPHFGLASPHVGSAFGMGSHAGPAYGIGAPQVGASFGMSPQVGAPFGIAPVLNPFGPFGSLNRFNPFNRILGDPVPTTHQPTRLRLFGAPDVSATSTTTATTAALPNVFTQNLSSSSTKAPTTKDSLQPTESTVGATPESDEQKKVEADQGEGEGESEEDDDEDEHENTEAPKSSSQADDDEDSDSALNAEQLIKKGEEKLKADNKRKRQNARYSNNSSQKRKYLHRL